MICLLFLDFCGVEGVWEVFNGRVFGFGVEVKGLVVGNESWGNFGIFFFKEKCYVLGN